MVEKLIRYIYNLDIHNKRGETMKDYLLRMPAELHTKVKIAAFSSGLTMAQFIIEAIKEKLEREV